MRKQSAIKNYGLLIDRNYRLIKQSYLKTFKEVGVDITTEQWVVLDNLCREDGLSQNELAAVSFKNPPTLSRIIDLLVKKNWLERRQSPDDKRSWLIFLKDEGRATHKQLSPHVKKLRAQGWEGLSEEDFVRFLEIMDRVYGNFSE